MIKRFFIIFFILFSLSATVLMGTMAWFTDEEKVPVAVNAATLEISLPLNDLKLEKVYPGYIAEGKSITLENCGDIALKYKILFSTEEGNLPTMFDKVRIRIYEDGGKDTALAKTISDCNTNPYEGSTYLEKGLSRTIFFDFEFLSTLEKSDFDQCKTIQIVVKATQVENYGTY